MFLLLVLVIVIISGSVSSWCCHMLASSGGCRSDGLLRDQRGLGDGSFLSYPDQRRNHSGLCEVSAKKEGDAGTGLSCKVLGAQGAIFDIMIRSSVYLRIYEENLS